MAINPHKIRLDAATACQLKCPSCPTATGDIAKSIGAGFVKLEDFKKFIDDNPQIKEIELSSWGEIFLHPEITKIIEYAYSKNVILDCNNGSNFNRVSDEALEALVKYRFRSITCAIDGASSETYAIYRRNGDFEQVLKNIRKLNEIKKKYKSPWPQLKWQFIVFGHNEHEINKARQMAKSLGMRFWVKLAQGGKYTGEEFSPVKDKDLVRRESGVLAADQDEYEQIYKEGYGYKIICSTMWHQPQINFDGKLLGCCVNYWGDYGNAFKEKLSTCLNNERMEYARGMLMGKNEARDDIPCTSCVQYKSMNKHKSWITKQDLFFSKLIYRFRYWLQNDKFRFLLLWYFTAKGKKKDLSRVSQKTGT